MIPLLTSAGAPGRLAVLRIECSSPDDDLWVGGSVLLHPVLPLKEGDSRAMATTTKLKTTLRPLHDRVLIKRLEEQDEKHGSIIIPDSAKEKPQEGKVIAAGTGRVTEEGKTLPLVVKAGDRILFGKYSGSEVKIDGEELLIMKEEDILGILD
jgi:chaperonin GroES